MFVCSSCFSFSHDWFDNWLCVGAGSLDVTNELWCPALRLRWIFSLILICETTLISPKGQRSVSCRTPVNHQSLIDLPKREIILPLHYWLAIKISRQSFQLILINVLHCSSSDDAADWSSQTLWDKFRPSVLCVRILFKYGYWSMFIAVFSCFF